MDLRQTLHYANYMASQGWSVERIDNTNYFIRKFPLIGSILKLQRPERLDLNKVRNLAEKYRSFQVIIEPKSESDIESLMTNGYSLSASPYLPTKTLKIDLAKSEKAIYADLQRNIRTGIKRASFAKGYGWPTGEHNLFKEYSSPKELEVFQKAWQKSVKLSRYVPTADNLINLRKAFPSSYSVFLASHNIIGSIIGGVIFTRVSHDSVNYMYGFSSQEGRTSLAHAALLYQGILWGKRMGCKVFDFEGIYDERFPNKSWLGFTRFKHSFGGFEVAYPGCYTKVRLPIRRS
jgi:hypothetical protein